MNFQIWQKAIKLFLINLNRIMNIKIKVQAVPTVVLLQDGKIVDSMNINNKLETNLKLKKNNRICWFPSRR